MNWYAGRLSQYSATSSAGSKIYKRVRRAGQPLACATTTFKPADCDGSPIVAGNAGTTNRWLTYRASTASRLASRGAAVLAAVSTILVLCSGQAFAYGYHYNYEVSQNVDANDAFDYVKTHFDSVFPAATSRSNCGSDLYVGLECDLTGVDNKGHIRIEEVGDRHFVVRSLKGHGEGANKLINFTFTTSSDRVLTLDVTASGKDNTWQKIPFAKRANRVFASSMWSDFASNVTVLVHQGDIPRMIPAI